MRLTQRLVDHGERPALVFPGRAPISYAELGRRVGTLAREFGTQKKLVAVVAEPCEHAVISYLAALHGNHAVAMIPSCNSSALDDFIADFAPDIVCRRVDGRWRCTAQIVRSALSPHPELALMLGTSGSTGKSQFVRLSATAVEANARAIAGYLGLTPQDRAALILPFHYSYGLSVLNSHLEAGAGIYFPRCGASDAGFAAEMREAACTNISGVPYSFEMLERRGFLDHDLPALRFMTAAGGRMPPRLTETFRRRLEAKSGQLFLMYGQTEATARIAYVPPQSLAENPQSIGIAIPGGRLWLADRDGKPIERDNVEGELFYSGPNVMMGYASERSDLARGAEIDALKTGDLAIRNAQGFYSIAGRSKRISKIAGLRVNHEAVERALEKAGMTATVIGDDERLLAILTGSPASDDDVLRVMMATSALPRPHLAVDRIAVLPRLPSGKIDYAALRLRLHRSGPVRGVMEAYRDAFYPRTVAPGDSFDGLGGDSLLYVQLSLAIERELGTLPAGWETMPVSALQRPAAVETGGQSVDSQLVLRALSILMIVVHHATTWPVPGGAAILVMLVGFGLARFQRRHLFAGDIRSFLRPLFANLALYVPIVIGFSMARGEVLWPSVLLVGNLGFTQPPHMLPYLYWFVEAYAQIMLLAALFFSVPSLRKLVVGNPLKSGLVLLAAAVAAKFLVPKVWNLGGVQIFTLPDVFYLAVFGWCLFFVDRAPARRIFLLGAAVLCAVLAWWGGNWVGSWIKYMLVLGAVAMLLFVPRLRLPGWLVRVILPVSAASYHIYLFHRLIPDWLLPEPDPGAPQLGMAVVAIVIGIASGLAVFRLQQWLLRWLATEGLGRRSKAPAVLTPAE